MTCPHSDDRLFVHWIDGEDRIVQANECWWEFARENDAPGLHPNKVLGRTLWEFISDVDTREVLHLVIDRARKGLLRGPIPYRCDNHDSRRYMEMTVKVAANGLVEFENRIASVEPRKRRLDSWGPRRGIGGLVRVCGWCSKVHVENCWVEVEDAVKALELFLEPSTCGVTHGICPSCVDRMTV